MSAGQATLAAIEGARVLVTGGAGFIGSHLVDGLVELGARVRVLDDLSSGKRDNLARHGSEVELLVGDIRDAATCLRATEGVSLVFHEAALGSVPRSMSDPATTLAVNVAGTANVFAAARTAGVARVVYASSSSVYGDSETLPKREGEEGKPLSPYALSKWMNEELAACYARCFDMSFVGLRYFNVFGPRQDPNGPYAAVVPRFFAACAAGVAPVIFGDGAQSRDFTYVGDVVRANLLAATVPLPCAIGNVPGAAGGGSIIANIGAGGSTTVSELAETLCRVAGDGTLRPEHAPARPGDILHSTADASRALQLFGFAAEVPLREGLARIAASLGR